MMRAGAVVALALASLSLGSLAKAQVPLTGHYPPGQSGIRGAATPEPGFAYTNFNRFFTNLHVVDADGASVREPDELRYANISMITWTTDWEVLGMRYGALAGIPFATGDLQDAADESGSFGLGDVLVTPIALYGVSCYFDYTLQFTLWSASGRFSPGAPDNRGTGFWSLVYSLGGVYYPDGARDAWSISALARFEQNFEQADTGIRPGADLVIDWGVGRVLRAGSVAFDLGVSGFGTWQLTHQRGGEPEAEARLYSYFGLGPEASAAITEAFSARIRAHWEFAARNVVRGNNLWIVLSYRW
ncbi:MAG TPA: transporter [Polyangiales bacterium]|nr:transporter [Polyangiales bacterium]